MWYLGKRELLLWLEAKKKEKYLHLFKPFLDSMHINWYLIDIHISIKELNVELILILITLTYFHCLIKRILKSFAGKLTIRKTILIKQRHLKTKSSTFPKLKLLQHSKKYVPAAPASPVENCHVIFRVKCSNDCYIGYIWLIYLITKVNPFKNIFAVIRNIYNLEKKNIFDVRFAKHTNNELLIVPELLLCC